MYAVPRADVVSELNFKDFSETGVAYHALMRSFHALGMQFFHRSGWRQPTTTAKAIKIRKTAMRKQLRNRRPGSHFSATGATNSPSMIRPDRNHCYREILTLACRARVMFLFEAHSLGETAEAFDFHSCAEEESAASSVRSELWIHCSL